MFSARLRSLLAHRRLPWAALGLALLLVVPSLGYGLRMDDRLHRLFVRGDPLYPGLTAEPHRLFDFFTGPDRIEMFRRTGMVAWYADPQCSIAFFRPLSSLIHYAEHRWLGDQAWAMHALSVALYVALMAAAWALYRRLFTAPEGAEGGRFGGPEAVGLATWIFALDHTHGLVVGWIAQRNSLLAALFGVLAVVAHDRARRDGDRRAQVAAPALALLSLLSAEAGSATLAALLAHALTMEPRGRRLRALAPYALAVGPWLVAYAGGGYGVRGSGMYLDPLRSPGTALPQALEHYVAMLGGALGNPLIDFWPLVSEPVHRLTVVVSAALLVGFALAAVPVLRRDPPARFLALAWVLALLPPSATVPQSRLLLFSSVFQLGLLARVAASLLRDGLSLRRPWRWLAAGVTGYAAAGHALLSPLMLATTPSQMVAFERALGRFAQGLPDTPGVRAVVLNAPDLTFLGYLSLLGPAMGKPGPVRMMGLANGTRDVEITAVDEHTLVVKSQGGFVHGATDGLTRAPRTLTPGATFDAGEARFEITHLDERGHADTARVRFAVPLSDPSLAFLRWERDTLVAATLPAQGQTLRLPAQSFLPLVLAASQGGGADVPGR